MLKLQVIVVSTRPGRVGLPVGKWFHALAQSAGVFETEFVDLAEVNLPLMDEPAHPRLKKYTHDHTKAWSARVDAADAFVFVTPEYNYSAPAPLINAVSFLFQEWNYKPAAFVSYGGISGGTRSSQMAKQLLTAVRVMPLPEAVIIPFVGQHVADGVFKATDAHEKSARDLLPELLRWAEALRPMRAPRG